MAGEEALTLALQGPVPTSCEYTELLQKESTTSSDLIKVPHPHQLTLAQLLIKWLMFFGHLYNGHLSIVDTNIPL